MLATLWARLGAAGRQAASCGPPAAAAVGDTRDHARDHSSSTPCYGTGACCTYYCYAIVIPLAVQIVITAKLFCIFLVHLECIDVHSLYCFFFIISISLASFHHSRTFLLSLFIIYAFISVEQ